MMLYSFAKFFLGPLVKLLLLIKFNNREKIPKDENYIICANHTVWFDPIFLALASKKKLHFMAKRELYNKPAVKLLLDSLGAFPVNRSKPVDESDRYKESFSGIDSAMEVLNRGECIGMFPEGTRVKKNMGEVKARAGISMLAAKCDVKIIPAGISSPIKPFKRTIINIGDPIIFPKERYGDLTHDEYVELSQQVLKEIKRLRDL